MNTVTWTTKRVIIPAEPFELPERIKTKHGNQLLRLPDLLRVNGKLYISKRYADKIRRLVAQSMNRRIDEMMRKSFYAGKYAGKEF